VAGDPRRFARRELADQFGGRAADESRPAYCSRRARESAMSRLRIVSWPMRSVGPNAASPTRSIDSFSGAYERFGDTVSRIV
jgi:hypothetical protein